MNKVIKFDYNQHDYIQLDLGVHMFRINTIHKHTLGTLALSVYHNSSTRSYIIGPVYLMPSELDSYIFDYIKTKWVNNDF